jgi:hypothetical protein
MCNHVLYRNFTIEVISFVLLCVCWVIKNVEWSCCRVVWVDSSNEHSGPSLGNNYLHSSTISFLDNGIKLS